MADYTRHDRCYDVDFDWLLPSVRPEKVEQYFMDDGDELPTIMADNAEDDDSSCYHRDFD